MTQGDREGEIKEAMLGEQLSRFLRTKGNSGDRNASNSKFIMGSSEFVSAERLDRQCGEEGGVTHFECRGGPGHETLPRAWSGGQARSPRRHYERGARPSSSELES